jgi:calcium-dependent protein kinase
MQVLRNKPDFRRKPWPTISTSAKDFVQKLLVKDPRARLTAAQALCMCHISFPLKK